MRLSIHELEDGNLGVENNMPFTDMNDIPTSVTHDHIRTRIHVISSGTARREEREAWAADLPAAGS